MLYDHHGGQVPTQALVGEMWYTHLVLGRINKKDGAVKTVIALSCQLDNLMLNQ